MILLQDYESPSSFNGSPYVRIRPHSTLCMFEVLIAKDPWESIILEEKDAVQLAHIILEQLT